MDNPAIIDTACHAYEIMRRANEEHLHREEDLRRPFYMLAGHLKISRDGNKWCVLLGGNLQDGVAGFGDSPDLASYDFDRNWCAKLPAA